MGESSQIEKMLKKIERTLDKCETEHIFRGTIFEFDTVGSVPKERLIKGILVDGKEGMRRVDYSDSLGGQSIVNASSLNVGDPVVILGAQHPQRVTATLPLLIVHPREQTLLFAREPESHQWGGVGDTVQAALWVILGFISASIVLISLLPTFWNYWVLLFTLCIAAVAMLFLIFGIEQYRHHTQRARAVCFDLQGWEHVVNIINSRFHLER